MAKKQWISLFGLWVMLFLFLGFPTSWDKGIAVISGLAIILISYTLTGGQTTSQKKEEPVTQTPQSTFIENGNTPQI
jgi:hypothetical protein